MAKITGSSFKIDTKGEFILFLNGIPNIESWVLFLYLLFILLVFFKSFFFLKLSNLIWKPFFYIIAVFDLIRQFVPKIYYLICKNSNKLVDLISEICFDSKHQFWGEILKKCLPWLEISLFWKFQ